MLAGFSVSNFKSFQDTQTISFIASKTAMHKEHIFSTVNRKILKSALIFGANAGGKSNLIDAIDFSKEIILSGMDNVSVDKNYFRINSNAYHIPGIFEYRLVTNDTEYSYGIAILYDKKEICGEWLVKIEADGKEETIFNRETDEHGMSFVTSDKIEYDTPEAQRMKFYLEAFGTDISDSLKKKTILSDISERVNGKQEFFYDILNVHESFNDIIAIYPNSKYTKLNTLVYSNVSRNIFSDLMLFFDTGIEKVEGKEQPVSIDKLIQFVPEENIENFKYDISNSDYEHPVMLKLKQQFFAFRKDKDGNVIYNKMKLNHGNDKELFDYSDESDGTKRLFDLIPLFFFLNKKYKTILIDEIDRSLHSNLTKRFIELFYNITKQTPCQLMATTHDSNLLDLDLLRKDEIWFVERNPDHSSQIYSLNRYKEHFSKEINKEYLIGRYGAIPFFNENLITGEYGND
ncbi:MAG: ATP-binding protein [Lachnospiraceae bacterium]|nr:ATP-binding protein [Lachnospiraceae bacterium]